MRYQIGWVDSKSWRAELIPVKWYELLWCDIKTWTPIVIYLAVYWLLVGIIWIP